LRIISKKKIRDYVRENSQAKLPLVEWYFKMKEVNAIDISDLKKVFNSVDAVYGYTIFNIGGNNYRLITAIHYNKQVCYIRDIWTHSQYSKNYNQLKLQKGKL